MGRNSKKKQQQQSASNKPQQPKKKTTTSQSVFQVSGKRGMKARAKCKQITTNLKKVITAKQFKDQYNQNKVEKTKNTEANMEEAMELFTKFTSEDK